MKEIMLLIEDEVLKELETDEILSFSDKVISKIVKGIKGNDTFVYLNKQDMEVENET